jgi:hypothetical protein
MGKLCFSSSYCMFSSRSRGGNWQNPANNFLGKESERRKTTDKEELFPGSQPRFFSNSLLISSVEEGDW